MQKQPSPEQNEMRYYVKLFSLTLYYITKT